MTEEDISIDEDSMISNMSYSNSSRDTKKINEQHDENNIKNIITSENSKNSVIVTKISDTVMIVRK